MNGCRPGDGATFAALANHPTRNAFTTGPKPLSRAHTRLRRPVEPGARVPSNGGAAFPHLNRLTAAAKVILAFERQR